MSLSTSNSTNEGPGVLERVGQSLTERAGSLRIIEFLLGVMLAFVGAAVPGIPVALPLAYISVILIVMIAATRRPEREFPGNAWSWIFLLFGAFAFTSLVSVVGGYSVGDDWIRRLVRVSSVVLMAIVLATGRVHLESVVRGYLAMLILNVPLFYAGIAPDNYGDSLTGILNDKNQAGLNYAIAGVLALWVYRSKVARVLIFVFFAGCLWLTESRTSLAALAVAGAWYILAGKVSVFFRIVWGAALVWGVNYLEENFARVGVFADRSGTDALRDRIDAGMDQMVANTPWFGRGWGEAMVNVQDLNWFFHNAYLMMRVEGGWPLVIVSVTFTVFVGIRLLYAKPVTTGRLIAQAASFVILVCAWKLGDVFLTSAWGLVMALGLKQFIDEESEPAVPDEGIERAGYGNK